MLPNWDAPVMRSTEWQANMEAIASRLSAAGIKVIWGMPSHTGSISQSYSMNRSMLTRLLDGVA